MLGLIEAAANRRAAEAQLRQMNDRELADLGLGRSGIQFAVRTSRGPESDRAEDPSGHSRTTAFDRQVRQAASAEADSPRAWLSVAAAFLAGFVVFGIVYSFSILVEPMAVEFHSNHAAGSAFFSISSLTFYGLGPLAGHLSDRFGPRIVVGAGAFLLGIGFVFAAFSGQMWQAYLAYGVGIGIGAACAYLPTLSIVGGWFERRRKAAVGIATTGAGGGVLLVPPLVAVLIETYGWRVADLILGAGCAALLTACAAMAMRPPLARAPIERPLGRVVSSPAFVMLYVSWVLATSALFVPFMFLPAFALDHGAGPVAAAALISVIGGMSLVCRSCVGVLGDRIGALRFFKIATFVMAASYAIWLTTTDYGWLLVFAAVFGFGYGVRIALVPVVLIELFGLRNLGAILGIFFTATGISALVGPPLAGFIIDHTGSYRWGIAFALAMGLLGFAAALRLKSDDASGCR